MNTLRLFLLSPGGEVLLHWTALLMLAWAANGLLCRSHPRWRLILWRSVLVLGCLLPSEGFFRAAAFRIPLSVVPAATPALPNPPIFPALGRGAPAAAPTAMVPGQAAPRPTGQIHRGTKQLLLGISWGRLSLLLWTLGGAAGTIRLCRLQLRLSHLCRNAREPGADLLARAREIQDRLGVRRPVRLLVSDEITSPFVCGLRHPTMMLPVQLLRTLSQTEISALLSHEMAHLRSRDLFWCVSWRWMKSLCWFHPLVWKAPRTHDLACEQEADRVASSRGIERNLYTQSLAQLALRVFALSSVESALTLNGCSQITQRINLLRRQSFRAWRWRDSVTGSIFAAGLALVAAGWGFSQASGEPSQIAVKQPATIEMKHYESAEWHFALDIPKSWNAFPPVPSNSQFEVIRFVSQEDGIHLLIVFRNPKDSKKSIAAWSGDVQKILARDGFGNFVTGQTTIGSRSVGTLDFDKPESKGGGTWSCRHYFIADGTLGYVLGFGTNRKAEMFDLYDRMAKSFQILE